MRAHLIRRAWEAEKAIIATVTSANRMQAISGGLGVNETLMVIGAVGTLTANMSRRVQCKHLETPKLRLPNTC
jgi:hypothetical protein